MTLQILAIFLPDSESCTIRVRFLPMDSPLVLLKIQPNFVLPVPQARGRRGRPAAMVRLGNELGTALARVACAAACATFRQIPREAADFARFRQHLTNFNFVENESEYYNAE